MDLWVYINNILVTVYIMFTIFSISVNSWLFIYSYIFIDFFMHIGYKLKVNMPKNSVIKKTNISFIKR